MIPSNFGLYAAILLMGIGQGIFLSLAIYISPARASRSNTLLATLIMILVLELIDKFLVAAGYIHWVPQSSALNWALDFFIGPVIYLYTRSMTSTPEQLTKLRYREHFILPIAGLVGAMFLGFSYSGDDFRMEYVSEPHFHLDSAEMLYAVASIIAMSAYILASFRRLHEHQSRIASNFSYTEEISLRWLHHFLTVILLLLVLYLSQSLVVVNFSIPGIQQLLPLGIVLAVFGIGFLGLKQPQIFTLQEGKADYIVEDQPPKKEDRYKKSALSDTDSTVIYSEICQLMDAEKLYRESKLSLPELANRMDLPSHYISQAINQCSSSNFFEFINKRRIQYVREQLSSPEDAINILDTAMDAGFNSKSAFYAAFKAHTGLTPRQYQRQNLSNKTT